MVLNHRDYCKDFPRGEDNVVLIQWSLRFKTSYTAIRVWPQIEGVLKLEGYLSSENI